MIWQDFVQSLMKCHFKRKIQRYWGLTLCLIKLQPVWTRLRVFFFLGGVQLLPFHLPSNVAVRNLSGVFSETQDGSAFGLSEWMSRSDTVKTTHHPTPETRFTLNTTKNTRLCSHSRFHHSVCEGGCARKVSSRTASAASKTGGFMKSGR